MNKIDFLKFIASLGILGAAATGLYLFVNINRTECKPIIFSINDISNFTSGDLNKIYDKKIAEIKADCQNDKRCKEAKWMEITNYKCPEQVITTLNKWISDDITTPDYYKKIKK